MSSGLAWWLDEIGRFPLLTPAQEIELGTAIQAWRNHPEPCPPGIRRRGQRARDRFVQSNLKLVIHYLTNKCFRLIKQHSEDDLIQAGNEGLIKAVERFDPTRGYRFSTYAYWWIRQSVNSFIEHHGRTVAIPASHHQHMGRLGRTLSQFTHDHGRNPSRPELAAAMGLSERVLEAVLTNAQPIQSLDLQVGDGEMELEDVFPSHDLSIEEQEEQLNRQRQAEELRTLVQQLPPVERQVVTLAYGLDGEQRTPRDVAQAMGMSVRAAEARLSLAEGMLRRMTVQQVLLTVPTIQPPDHERMPRPRRRIVAEGQLSLPGVVSTDPVPSAGATAAVA